jgi:hypothetical protein
LPKIRLKVLAAFNLEGNGAKTRSSPIQSQEIAMSEKSAKLENAEMTSPEEKSALANEAMLAFLHEQFIWETPRYPEDDTD